MEKNAEEIRKLFPEIEQISDAGLRRKVADTWVEAWKASPYDRLEETPMLPGGALPEVNNVAHTRAVIAGCIQFARVAKEILHIAVNMDYLIAGAVLHDIGKVFEFCETPSELGRLFTHRLSALYLAARQDLPLEVIHIIAMHSLEGELKKRTTEAAIVYHIDCACAGVAFGAKTGGVLAGHTKFQVIQKYP